ncbi:MAG: hypothetical protein LLG45_03650 [Actinomycetia bacterium]|nr:hypothetical protein [Actinomycetes bacterium]
MKRLAIFGGLVVLFTMVISGVALAATPQDIYDDFAADGRLDGTYTEAEFQAYLNDATVHGYGDPGIIAGLDKKVIEILGGRETFPFTGFEVAFASLAMLALVGVGVGLRTRAGRAR